MRCRGALEIAIEKTARAAFALTLGGDGVLQLQSYNTYQTHCQHMSTYVQAASQSGELEIDCQRQAAWLLVILTAVAISSSSYLVALHTRARRPAAGAAAARMLAVDCFMVRAIVTGLAVRRVGRCPCEAKVERQARARPIECSAEQQKTRVLVKP